MRPHRFFATAAATLCASLGLALAVSTTPAALAAPTDPRWMHSPMGPIPGSQEAVFQSVAAAGPNDAFAAGYRQIYLPGVMEFRTWIQHWDGSAWTTMNTPDVESAPANNMLWDIAAASPKAAWAVGSWRDRTGGYPLVLRWDGSTWTRQPVPLPSPGGWSAWLNTVVAASPTNVWAAGTYRAAGDFTDQPFAVHWDGVSWQVVPVPRPWACEGSVSVGDLATRDGRVVLSYQCQYKGKPAARLVEWTGTMWKGLSWIGDYRDLAGLAITDDGDVWLAGGAVKASTGAYENRVTRRSAATGTVVMRVLRHTGGDLTINDIAAPPTGSFVHVVGVTWDTTLGQLPMGGTVSTSTGFARESTPSTIGGMLRAAAVEPTGVVWGIGYQHTRPNGLALRRAE